jgi:hypothetical protein
MKNPTPTGCLLHWATTSGPRTNEVCFPLWTAHLLRLLEFRIADTPTYGPPSFIHYLHKTPRVTQPHVPEVAYVITSSQQCYKLECFFAQKSQTNNRSF